MSRPRARRAPPDHDEDRHLQHQQRQPPPAESAAVAEGRQARRRLPAGAEVHRRRNFPARRSRRPAIARSGAGRRPGTASPSWRAAPSRSLTRTALPGDADDTQARYIEAAVDGILVGCIYLPNGNPQPGPKFDYKLAWFKRLHRPCPQAAARRTCRWCSPATTTSRRPSIDIYPTTSWDDDALVQPQAARPMRACVKQGWTDALRELHPGRAHLHVLALHAQSLGAQRRPAHRSPAAQPVARPAPRSGRRRPHACAASRAPATTRRCGSSLPCRKRARAAAASRRPQARPWGRGHAGSARVNGQRITCWRRAAPRPRCRALRSYRD